MKLGARAFAALIALACWPLSGGEPPPKKWGPVTNDARISLVLKGGGAGIKTNQAFLLSISVQNLSTNETLCVYSTWPPELDPRCSFRVLSPSGKDVSPAVPMVYGGSGTSSLIPRNETKEFDFDLTKLCKFTEIGTYGIVVNREIWRLSNRPPFIARSASLPLTVVPGLWEGHSRSNAPLHW